MKNIVKKNGNLINSIRAFIMDTPYNRDTNELKRYYKNIYD